jgi:hypothetical protein
VDPELCAFLEFLFETGRVTVSDVSDGETPAGTDPTEWPETAGCLARFEATWRTGLAFDAPGLDLPAAVWGAVVLHRAVQCLVFRDRGPEEVAAALSAPGPEPPSPAVVYSVVYSVDLALRFLPDVGRLARAAAPDDPLVSRLLALGRDWPLSSVGVAGVDGVSVESFIDDRCLRALYVDRVLGTEDVGRLRDARVREAARAALGEFADLSPRVAAALATSPGEA